MFSKLTEEDFAILREPLVSGRQSFVSLGGTLFLGCFLQFLHYYLVYYVAAQSNVYPNVEKIQTIHFWITLLLTVFSALFTIPTVYKKFQKAQYLLGIVVSQNLFGFYFYLGALFLIGEKDGSTAEYLITFTYFTLAAAAALFLAVFIRFYVLLKKGEYREGSLKGELREKLETSWYIPIAIIVGTGIVLIINSIKRYGILDGIESIMSTVLPMLLFYTMIFVLPEQLVILYCKFRFKSFNFEISGHLYDMEDTKANTLKNSR